MTDTAFDPGGFYEFDLGRGTVRTQAGGRVVVLTDNVLAPLVSAAATQGDLTAVRRLGKQLGEQILANAGGDVEGSDPALKHEYVVFSAHMDHVGTGTPVNGDSIFNGADDDASGTVGIVELAEAYSRPGARPKRSLNTPTSRRQRFVM